MYDVKKSLVNTRMASYLKKKIGPFSQDFKMVQVLFVLPSLDKKIFVFF